MLCGFIAAAIGDWLLAIRGAPRYSSSFAIGVAAFLAAQIFWTYAQSGETRLDWRVFTGAALPLGLFAFVRLGCTLPPLIWMLVVAYSLATACALSVALATRRRFFALGISLLAVSDLAIGGRLLGSSLCSVTSGPLYAAAEICIIASFLLGDREPRYLRPRQARPLDGALCWGGAAFASFMLAAFSWPGGGYNPCMRMLSALGRTVAMGVEWPWCHWFFMAGMFFAALAVISIFLLELETLQGWRREVAGWGIAANAGGLIAIALIPENVQQLFHNVGCWSATLGGGAILIARFQGRRDCIWLCILGSVTTAFSAAIFCHAVIGTPYLPWVPILQKCVIISFAIWGMVCARHAQQVRVRRRVWVVVALLTLLVVLRGMLAIPRGMGATEKQASDRLSASSASEQALGGHVALPMTEDERAALRWLEYVTGPLTPEEERNWWYVGGTQHGLFAKRYHIAFCGYAAAALGTRGGENERDAAGRILGRCIERMLARDVWAYSMSKSYWGRKPWAPDPCFRENVMFTGHLLQLLALYECYTHDTRYWTEGWDFVWKDGRRIHYDVKRLVAVTVEQMRFGPNGGITCEPGLMFFPCNNHPHIALAIFAALKHGDWTKEARCWEKWALAHYQRPLFGGGALSLVYHVRSGLLYSSGVSALDGWSLLWYEPWAGNRADALELWRSAAAALDWTWLENGIEQVGKFHPCCNPADVTPSVAAAFLAAAARACDDAATAERLEKITDRFLVRRDGMLWLDTNREWRIGTTAMRIISLAESNGFRFRAFLRDGIMNCSKQPDISQL